jgi:tripartite-type tricarboxylate transporter receptor subunit TctC
MKLLRRRFLHLAAAVAAVVVLTVILITLPGYGARSQTSRTVKIVVPVQAGGSIDILARLLSQQIGRAPGQTVVVENRPGAGSIIGTEVVSRAAPDGS